jgi:hypothetical protein
VNARFLAVCLWVIAGCFTAAMYGTVRDGVRRRDPGSAALACAVAVLIITVLADAGADLW